MSRRLNLSALVTIGGAVSGTLGSAAASTRAQFRGIGSAIRNVEDRQRELQTQMREFAAAGRDVGGLQREYDRLGGSLARLNRRHQALNTTRSQLAGNRRDTANARAQLGDAIALGAAFVVPVRIAAQFENQIERVGGISRASEADVARLGSTARALGASTEWSATQAAQGMEFLAMSGFGVGETIEAMPGLLSLATAGQLDLGRTAQITSNSLRGFQLEASETNRVGDVLTNVFTTSNTELSGLGDTLGYVAPVAAAVGVTLEETAAAAGLLGNAGISGTRAGTALRAIISRLASPSSEAAAALANLGIRTQDAEGNLRPLGDVLRDVSSATAEMGTATRADLLNTVFGLESVSAATVLVGHAGSGELARYTASVSEAGSATALAERMAGTSVGTWKGLKSAMESNAIVIGNALLPGLTAVGSTMADGLRWISQTAERYPRVTQVVVGVTASLVALRVAHIAGRMSWLLFRGAMLSAKAAALVTQGALTFVAGGIRAISLAMASNPIGLAIAAIGIAALVVWKYWEPISAFFSGLWSDTVEIFNFGLDKVRELLGWQPGAFARRVWRPLVEFFGSMWQGLRSAAGTAWGFVRGLLGWTPLGLIIRHWSPIAEFFGNLFGGVLTMARDTFEWVANAAVSAGRAVGLVSDNGPLVDSNGDAISDGAAALGLSASPSLTLPNLEPRGPVNQTAHVVQEFNFTVHKVEGENAFDMAQRMVELARSELATTAAPLFDPVNI